MRRARRNFVVLTYLLVTAFFCLAWSETALAWDAPIEVTLFDLADKSLDLNGKTVHFQAEVIGDIMKRNDGVWVNVLDRTGGAGVFMSLEMASGLRTAGDYKHKGDVVEVVGVFNRCCSDHGGDPDVHALSVRIVAHGFPVYHQVSSRRILTAVLCAGAAAVLWLLSRRRIYQEES